VERYRIIDAAPDRVFQRIAALAARFLDAPMATVSIVDRDRIFFAATHGLGTELRQVRRDEGLCANAISGGDDLYVVQDAQSDPRTAENGFVRENHIVFYACAPLVTFDGHRLGALAVMDHQMRMVSEEELAVLHDLAVIVMEQLELRLSAFDALRIEQRLRDAAEYARDDARQDRNTAQLDRDEARRGRDDARLDRREALSDRDDARRSGDSARHDRDDAVRDRDVAEHERDLIQEYAAVLQRTLLPPSLPVIDGLVLASHYHPVSVSQVGGDFYDVFALGEDRWAFFIGDVEGHGAEAAAATSLIRYTLRAAALHSSDPIEVLAELNVVLLRETSPRRFCTVMFGTLAPHPGGVGFQFTIATGGHPPALLLDPGATVVQEVRSRGGMLVGATPNATFDSCSVSLQPGQTLLFYTDGIIEVRRGPTPFDHESLSRFALARVGHGATRVVEELATLIPKLDPDDDIALLAFSAG
jgi:phosphoserine phosphatase RsbU/P